jgi:hypothetical protein
MPDVFKIFKDLELKAVGLDEKTKKMQEGYFVAFRDIGLPIHKEDYENPFAPTGVNLAKDIPKTEPTDPKEAPKTGSGNVDTSQAFAANVAKSIQSYLNTYVLVNNKLQMNNQYSVIPGSSHLDDTWYAVIAGANGIPPTMELNDSMKQAYAQATAKLMDKDDNLTPHFEKYRQYREAYESKVRSKNKAFAAAFTDGTKYQLWVTQDGGPYQDDVDNAWSEWMGFGFKEEIEKALNTLAAQGTDPAIALIARSKKRFQNSLLTIPAYGEIPYTMLSPRTWYDADNDDGWNEYTSKDLHSESQYTASSTSYGGGGGFNVGLWSGSASFEHSDSQANGNFAMNNVLVSFSYAIVDIDRPWLDTSLLNLDNWFLVGDYKRDCISTGRMGQEKPSNGTEPLFLPSVVTSVILVKDVHISWDNWKSQWSQHTQSNSASASVGVWCFTASAHYSHAKQSRQFSYDDSGEALVIPGIQLVGYVSQIMPECPRRNSGDFQKKSNN